MITTLTGKNEYQLKKSLHEIIDSFIFEHGDMAVEKLDGENLEYTSAVDAVSSAPFLTDKKLVVINQPSKLSALPDKIEEFTDRIADTTDVVFYEPKLDKGSLLAKFLKKNSNFLDINELKDFQLADWIVQDVKDKGGKITKPDASYLVNTVGENQNILAREVDKLLNYNPQITRENIDLLCEPIPRSSIFNLIDAAFAKRKDQALSIYSELRASRVDTSAIIAMITWQLHVLAVLKTSEDRTLDQISADTGFSPYSLQKSKRISGNMSMAQLLKMLDDLQSIDLRSKTTSDDTDSALKLFIIEM